MSLAWDELPNVFDGIAAFDPLLDDGDRSVAPCVTGEPVTLVLRDHGERLERLEAHVFREQLTPVAQGIELTPPAVAASSASTVSTTVSVQALMACPVSGCVNRTGLHDRATRHLAKHVSSRAHVESALALGSLDQLRHAVFFCACDNDDGDADHSVMVDLAKALGSQRQEVAACFERLDAVPFCCHGGCLRVRHGGADAALLEARESAIQALANSFHDDGTRKRRRDRLRGDRTVAIAVGEEFASPGACYVLYDTATNQLRVQQALPDATQTAFHVAHVARAHRWMEHIVHFDSQRHKLWQSHVPVAEAGFVDTFVAVDSRAQAVLRIDAGARQLDGTVRTVLFNKISSGDLLLCAGRSDGWLELRCCGDVGGLIALPLSHLQLHSVRLYDRDAPPSLLLASEGRAVSLTLSDARAAQHFHPVAVEPAKLKLELLCRCTGWHLVQRGANVSADARLAQALADVESLKRENARLREQVAQRNDPPPDVTFAPPALRSKAEIEAWMRQTSRRYAFYNTTDDAVILCVRRSASSIAHCKIKRTKSGGFMCAREVHADTLNMLVLKLNL